VLRGLGEGSLDAPAARLLVDRAKAMQAEVAEALPADTTIVDLARAMRSGGTGARTAEQLQALVRFAAYRVFVERHFLAEKAQWMRDRDE
jgi:hypothetical protein